MHPMLNIAIKAAEAAGKVILRHMDKLDSLRAFEKRANDFATEVDHQAENEIIKIIHRSYPGHSILAEESGLQTGEEYQWIVDPLDGTANYMHGFPYFCVSIGIKCEDKLEHAVIFEPVRNEMFTASRGNGARLNHQRIRVSKRLHLDGALLGTGFPHRNGITLNTYLSSVHVLAPKVSGIRRMGAAALDLAYVAAGRLDGLWEFDLAPWDMAAGALLVKEAGGLVGDPSGGENYLDTGHIVAGNPKIFKALLTTLKPLLS